MKIRLEDGQIVYVVGGNQMNSNDSSTKPYVQNLVWGETIPGQTPNLLIGTGMSFSTQYGWGNSQINLLTSPTPGSSSNILGGLQLANNMDSTGAWVESLNWGLSVPDSATNPTTIASARSFSTNYGWGNSEIQIYSTSDEPWMTIVGGYQECNNMNSSAEWVTTYSWGVQTGPKALIATLQAYSTTYQWGNSQVFLYFAEA